MKVVVLCPELRPTIVARSPAPAGASGGRGAAGGESLASVTAPALVPPTHWCAATLFFRAAGMRGRVVFVGSDGGCR